MTQEKRFSSVFPMISPGRKFCSCRKFAAIKNLFGKFPVVCSFPIAYLFLVQQQSDTCHFFSNHRSVNIRITVVLITSSNIMYK